MRNRDAHLSDEELVLAADGELSAARAAEIAGHLDACWTCRARRRQLEDAAADFRRVHQETPLPPASAARARLRARLAGIAAERPVGRHAWLHTRLHTRLHARLRAAAVGAIALIATVGIFSLQPWRWSRANRPLEVPSPRLTPGAARTADREQLCQAPLPKNQAAPADLRQRVFQAYGMANADPRAYEVDYLITPALGGAEDIRNLWPQPYVSTVWNARVKDALEDRLRDLVCGGQLDLAEAQREISANWIAAYKKYFQTDQPPPAP